MQAYYKMQMPTKYDNNDFYARWDELDTSDIIKSKCQEPAKFHHHPSVVYLTSILKGVY